MMHNWDKRLKRRYIRLGVKKEDSLNYFHSYAYLDRVDFSSFTPRVTPTMQWNADLIANSSLPTVDDDDAIRKSIMYSDISGAVYEYVLFPNDI